MIHDLTALVSFSLAAVWRARSAVWRTVRVSRLRHDPPPPPPPVGNLRTGKCFWTLTHERQILFVLLYFCLSSHRHEASILRVLPFSDPPPVSHVRFLFPHIQKMFQSFFCQWPSCSWPRSSRSQTSLRSNQSRFSKKNPTTCFNVKLAQTAEERLRRRRRSHATIWCPQIYWLSLCHSISFSALLTSRSLSLSL